MDSCLIKHNSIKRSVSPDAKIKAQKLGEPSDTSDRGRLIDVR